MELLKTQQELLELGTKITEELNLVGYQHTTSKWMAHYLAELIDAAENDETEEKRNQAKDKACQIILQLWEKRQTLPGNAYPLSELKEFLEWFSNILLVNYPSEYLSDEEKSTRELFMGFLMLFNQLFHSKIPREINDEEFIEESQLKFLNNEELFIYETMVEFTKNINTFEIIRVYFPSDDGVRLPEGDTNPIVSKIDELIRTLNDLKESYDAQNRAN